ncbi:ABC transporter permease [Actinopolymorpha pittospori]|uniref:Multiple sugar transport system permease protein/putative aldouronate transport system permease protein n=1 Tax=Actinopolymorpha pittospori TaxID=648752 RepID=A0A927RP16_9ACTN|nr:ABC transporter permease subunit [Actinopolymorpha pittospori]MBE1610638.1 multiple sugar transport system permease protein/putative aldouronate transport system permease protein [Actinopolymorpha pittospori]
MDTLARGEAAETISSEQAPRRRRRSRWSDARRQIRHGWQLYLMLLLPVAYVLVFQYWPMFGVQIAFRNYNVVQGITGSPWVGLQNFERFIDSYMFWPVIRNTIVLQGYELVATFPLPIVLALALNYVRLRWFKRSVQMITYAPHFISTVVIVGMLFVLLDPRTGLLNNLLGLVGIDAIDFMGNPDYFRHLYVWSGVWQSLGFNAIIYLAALAGIDPELHEAAIVDGATKIKRIWHIDLPGIAPIAVILLILNIGSILSIGFEKALLMQNPLNLATSEVIDTYVYKVGLASDVPQFSYAAAIGLFRSVVGLLLLVLANQLARRFAKSSLW